MKRTGWPWLVLPLLVVLLLGAGVPVCGEEGGEGDSLALALRAVAVLRAAGLDPAAEVQLDNVSSAAIRPAGRRALQEAGLDLGEVRAALKAHPEVLGGEAIVPPETPAEGEGEGEFTPGEGEGEIEPQPVIDEPQPVGPPPEGGTHGAPDGFGRAARGGSGGGRNVPASGLIGAVRGGGSIRCSGGDVDAGYDQFRIPANTTLDGGGATVWLPGTNHNGKGLEVVGPSVIIRNLRVRNSGDGICFGSSSNRGRARDILVENVSVTGSGDDGFSVAYDCTNITLRWCFIAGNARSIFMKYGGKNLTVHHSIMSHFWIRAPLVSGEGALVDFRNNLVEYWALWGSRCESGAKGDFVNNTWRQAGWAGGDGNNALFPYQGGEVYSTGNEFQSCSERRGSGSPLVNGPPVPTESAAAALQAVLSDTNGAGCMPRDRVDTNYLNSRERCPSGDPAHGLEVEGSLRGGR